MEVNRLPGNLDAEIAPCCALFEHGVEDHKQFSHAGCESQLLRFAGGQQPLVEAPDDGVIPSCHQRSHEPVERRQWLNEDSRSPGLRSLILSLECPDLTLRTVSNAVNQSGSDNPELMADCSATTAPIEERLL